MSRHAVARLDFASASSPGRVREHNEDALICRPILGLFAIADGMGGYGRGEVASALALTALEQAVAGGQVLAEAVRAANAAVREAAGDEPMGTTLVASQFDGPAYALAWVGDSRAYRVTAEALEPLTRDHSWVQAMIDAGQLDPEEAREHPRRNLIYQCLGRDEAIDAGLLEGRLQPGELMLLCSDGLTGELTDDEIHALCTGAETLEALVEQLVAAANARGGRDNISCLVLGLTGPVPAAASRPRRLLDKLMKPFERSPGGAA